MIPTPRGRRLPQSFTGRAIGKPGQTAQIQGNTNDDGESAGLGRFASSFEDAIQFHLFFPQETHRMPARL
jgi:hypothetical protein